MVEIGTLVKDFLKLHTSEQSLRKQVTESSKITKQSKLELIEAMESSDLKSIKALSSNSHIILVEKPKKDTLSCKNIKEVLLDHGVDEESVASILDKLTIKSDKINKILKIKKISKKDEEADMLQD
tara:strand:+ start:489 stop:866 length:378 start_codon:yes stop_codon:yes gene_type:complete